VLAVARRELGATFGQPAAYVFLAAFLCLSALMGLGQVLAANAADLRDYFAGLRYAFMFLAPAAAMRQWAEERRLGTLELLFTLPLRPWQAVLGKFLAGAGLIGAALLLGATLPLSLLPFGPFDAGQLFAGLAGAFLLGCTFLALGLLASALTTSQVVAFVLGASGCVVLGVLDHPLLVDQLDAALPRGLVRALVGLGVGTHYEAVTRGVLAVRDVAYFGGLTALFLFVNVLAVERRDREPSEPWVALTLAVLALLLWLDVTGSMRARLDLTIQRRNSLAPETRAVLDKVVHPLTVRAYVSERLPESARPHVRQVLDLLEDLRGALGSRLELELIDPDAPHLSALDRQVLERQAALEGIERVVLQVDEGDRRQQVRVYAGVSFHYGGRPAAVIPFLLGLQNPEYDLAVAIQRLVLPRVRVGLAGANLGSYRLAEQALRRAYAVQPLDFAQTAAVPDEVALLVYVASVPPSERETYVLDQFLARGGRLVVLAESHLVDGRLWVARPFPRQQPFLEALSRWGVELGPLVISPANRDWVLRVEGGIVRSRYPYYLSPGPEVNAESPVAASLGRLVFPNAARVRAGELAAEVEGVPLVWAAPGWTMPPPGEEGRDQDVHPLHGIPGLDQRPQESFPLALALSGTLPSHWAGRDPPARVDLRGGDDPLATPRGGAEPSRLVVVGDADFATDANQRESQGVALLINMVDWSLDRSLSGLQSRTSLFPLYADPNHVLGIPRDRFLGGLHVVFLPLVVLVGGLTGVALRKRRWAQEAAVVRDAKAAAVAEEAGA
jgi:ABC-2 type transport system permease protein